MKLKGIVDSGSTKADWLFVDASGTEVLHHQTKGFNPLIISKEEILSELNQQTALISIKENISELYFYGAGCSVDGIKTELKNTLETFFEKAEVKVDSDLMAACHAVYRGNECVVAILGTGSNACFFDGEKAFAEIPSLGFILGDEGSGNHIGRELLRLYFYNQMPENIASKFESQFDLKLPHVLESLYRKNQVNAYLAQFAEFAVQQKEEEFITELVKFCFQSFIQQMIFPNLQHPNTQINFVGSIAHYFGQELVELMEINQLNLGKILHKPIDGLSQYHYF
ncbi:MAG: hypothetical protein Q4G27_10495 [Flavobacteriaceae bacterium]|nr:hypothetical protein [Flavobacteriaceae bacterium]